MLPLHLSDDALSRDVKKKKKRARHVKDLNAKVKVNIKKKMEC